MKTANLDIHTSWKTIEAALALHAPRTLATLGPPATSQQIAALESEIGLHLPLDLAESLKIHDGQRDPTRLFEFSEGGMLLSTSEIREYWSISDSVHREELGRPPPVAEADYSRPEWWRSTLIPFTGAAGDMLCVDSDYALGSRRGEVIWHVHDDGLSSAIAPSYAHWLRDLARRLSEGQLRVDEHGFSHLPDVL